ncbi:MAG: glycosyltransferase family 39 protein, partial [Chloroflexota bacterium]|nr:glycosyltransferase family 39 protein [Chloroflexota bacterium]
MSRLNSLVWMQKLIYPLLLIVLLSGLLLRVWKVNFDHGMGSHPDERSTTSNYAVSIHLPQSWDEFWDPQRSPLNPLWSIERQERRSFTYGHFPLYLGVAFGEVLHALAPIAERLGVPDVATVVMARAHEEWTAIAVAGRLTIALLDTLTIFLLFLLGRRMFGPAAGLLAAAFYAFTAQAVQLSHFFATDPASTTFTALTVLGAIMMVQERTWRAALFTGVGAGLAIASKFSALPVLIIPFVAAFVVWLDARRQEQDGNAVDGRALFVGISGAGLAVLVAAVTFFLTSPYAVLDWQNFLRATLVEQGNMVRGLADFPFTRQYRNTTPYLYFIEQQVRWGLGWPLGVVAVLGTVYALVRLLRTVFHLLFRWFRHLFGSSSPLSLSNGELYNLVVWSWVLPYFAITGAFLAKFNRYMSPVLPFVLLFAAGLIWRLWR